MIIEVIEAAFIDAFDADDLKRLARYSLNMSLDRITQASSLDDMVHDLVTWAERADKVTQLVRVAKEITSNAKVNALPDGVRSNAVVVSRMNNSNQGQLEVISVRLELLTQQMKRIALIVEGEDGGNGVRGQSRENAREIAKIKEIVLDIQKAQSNRPHVLEDPKTKRYFVMAVLLISAPVIIEIAKLLHGAIQ